MRHDYLLHDRVYQRRRAAGYAGWQDSAQLAKTLVDLQRDFHSRFAPQHGRALEIGCGAGELTIWLAERGFDAEGVDISPTAIRWAEQKAVERRLAPRFTLGAVEDLAAFTPCCFDLVLDGHCLHCIIGDDRARCLASIHRVLKDTGVLYVRTMCFEAGVSTPKLSEHLRHRFDMASGYVRNDQGTATRFVGEPRRILDEIVAAGFTVLDWRIDRTQGELDAMDCLIAWARPA